MTETDRNHEELNLVPFSLRVDGLIDKEQLPELIKGIGSIVANSNLTLQVRNLGQDQANQIPVEEPVANDEPKVGFNLADAGRVALNLLDIPVKTDEKNGTIKVDLETAMALIPLFKRLIDPKSTNSSDPSAKQ